MRVIIKSNWNVQLNLKINGQNMESCITFGVGFPEIKGNYRKKNIYLTKVTKILCPTKISPKQKVS